ncbi:MAG: flagellin, partial [bacterium]
ETLERLSSGLRINKAADDPSGLQVATNFQRQIQGTRTAIQNAEDTLNLLRYADEALGGIEEVMIRMGDLCLKAANEAVVTSAEQYDLGAEFRSLKDAIGARANAIAYNGRRLFVGSYTANSNIDYKWLSKDANMTYVWNVSTLSRGVAANAVFVYGKNDGGMNAQIGPDNAAYYNFTVVFGTVTLTALGLTYRFSGANAVGAPAISTFDDGFSAAPLTVFFGAFGSAATGTSVKDNARFALQYKSVMNDAMDKIGDARLAVGMLEQKIESMIDALSSEEINLSAAKSRILDADMAQEISDLVRFQVISQAGIAALAQANMQPQAILSLLGAIG